MPQMESLADPSRPSDDDGPPESRTERVRPDTLFELLDDEYVQRILAEIETTAKSGRELAETCDASRSTVYRRLNRLEDAGWVETRMALDRNGHHQTLYEASLDAVRVELEIGGFRTETTICSPVVNR